MSDRGISSFPHPDAFPQRDVTVVNLDRLETNATLEDVDVERSDAPGGVGGRLRNGWTFVRTNFTVSEMSGSLGELKVGLESESLP